MSRHCVYAHWTVVIRCRRTRKSDVTTELTYARTVDDLQAIRVTEAARHIVYDIVYIVSIVIMLVFDATFVVNKDEYIIVHHLNVQIL